MMQYFCESSLWSMAGLLAGYFFGKMERDISDLKKRDRRDHT